MRSEKRQRGSDTPGAVADSKRRGSGEGGRPPSAQIYFPINRLFPYESSKFMDPLLAGDTAIETVMGRKVH